MYKIFPLIPQFQQITIDETSYDKFTSLCDILMKQARVHLAYTTFISGFLFHLLGVYSTGVQSIDFQATDKRMLRGRIS